MRTAIYVRVSTRNQLQSQTIEQQLARLLAHCEAQHWPIEQRDIFRDDGYSGAHLSRPGLDRLRGCVQLAEFQQMFIASPDRLARNYVHQVLLLEEFERRGCKVEFLDRPMSSDPHDQLLLQIRGAVAEYERTLITERMRRGRLMKIQAGLLLPWTKAPYGYRLDPERPRDPDRVRIDEAEAAIVAEIYAQYLEPNSSIRAVAGRIQNHGVPAPSGKQRWNVATVRNILTNPVYAGQVYAGRTRARQPLRRASPTKPIAQPGRSTNRLVPRQEWIEVGKISAIVTPQQF